MKQNKQLIWLGIAIAAIILVIVLLHKPMSSVDGKIGDFSPVQGKEGNYSRAIEINGGTGFINTDNIDIKSLIGKKVILLDFWTYSCINCIRTLPYLNSWNSKYSDDGLQIIGIHTPEFSFEKDYDNVKRAVEELNITYPVVLDSNYSIWNSYDNHYWPAEYIIDIDGYIREAKFGEGDYVNTENTIRELLEERAQKLGTKFNEGTSGDPKDMIDVDFGKVQSPETYFGAERNEYLSNGRAGLVGVQNLTIPSQLNFNSLYLIGTWNFTKEYAQPVDDDTRVLYGYASKNVYAVIDAPKGSTISVNVDGQFKGNKNIGPYDLYSIVNGSDYAPHVVELSNISKETKFYTFTFG